MPGITGMGTTYNLPNYTGELFALSREDTPLLSTIGGLTGGEDAGSILFNWQFYDLRDAATDRQRVEGAEAPDAEERVRGTAFNVVEIHQEAVELSYTRQSTKRQANTNGQDVVRIGNLVVPADELAFQINNQIKQVARDVNRTFIRGTYNLPTDNTTARKTRGLLQAITTNRTVTDKTSTQITEDDILDFLQAGWEKGGWRESETRTMLVGATMKRALTRIFIKDSGYKEATRDVGGVSLQTIDTDFGRANIMLDPDVPSNTLIQLSLEDVKPRFLEIEGKGHFFVEPLAKTGAKDKFQLYGEIGLEYGAEKHHGVLEVAA